jgi:hypothetical protein
MNIPMLHESRGSLILFFDGKIGGILQQRHLSMLESGYEATETDGETAGIVGKCFAATTARQSLIGIMMLHCAGENVAATTATATATKFAQLHEV